MINKCPTECIETLEYPVIFKNGIVRPKCAKLLKYFAQLLDCMIAAFRNYDEKGQSRRTEILLSNIGCIWNCSLLFLIREHSVVFNAVYRVQCSVR